jgi:hypothetical protein
VHEARHADIQGTLEFAGTAMSLPVRSVLRSPVLLAAALDDVCWRSALEGWIRREPDPSDLAAHTAWAEEVEPYERERRRIAALLVAAVPSAPHRPGP